MTTNVLTSDCIPVVSEPIRRSRGGTILKTGRRQGTTRREILVLAAKGDFTYKDYQGTYNTFYQMARKMVRRGELTIVKPGRHGGRDEYPTVYRIMQTLEQHPNLIAKRNAHGGHQWEYAFPNGYGASVVRHRFSYGNENGLFELAVLKNGHLCYDTPITQDVIGSMTEALVLATLDQIAKLSGDVSQTVTETDSSVTGNADRPEQS